MLRRRDREQQADALSQAVRASDQAERAARLWREQQSAARDERASAIAAERVRVDSGQVTAGTLVQSHRFRGALDARVAELEERARQAHAAAERADAEHARSARALERAVTAESLVGERLDTLAARVRERAEERDAESAEDARNAAAARQRSGGRR